MKQLLVVQAHGKAQESFDLNLPLFQRHGLPMLVISPTDDPISTTHEQVSIGLAGHSGEFAWRRLVGLLKELASRDEVEHFIILEYDSFFLTHRIPMGAGLGGLMQTSLDPAFYSLRYSTPPWTMDDLTVKTLYKAALDNPGVKEQGMSDRFFAALADLSGVSLFDYEPLGLARNTIEERDFPMVNRHLGAGAFAFHGVKTKAVRDYILKVWNSLQADTDNQISVT